MRGILGTSFLCQSKLPRSAVLTAKVRLFLLSQIQQYIRIPSICEGPGKFCLFMRITILHYSAKSGCQKVNRGVRTHADLKAICQLSTNHSERLWIQIMWGLGGRSLEVQMGTSMSRRLRPPQRHTNPQTFFSKHQNQNGCLSQMLHLININRA